MRLLKVGLVVVVISGISVAVLLRNQGMKVTKQRITNTLRRGLPVASRTTLALVNSVPITAGELQQEVDRLLPPTAAHGHTDKQQEASLRKNALDELVVRELAYQKAKAMQLQADPAELNATVMKIEGRYKTKENFQEALRAEGISEKEFTRRIEKDLLLRKLHKLEIDDRSAVSDSEALEFYNKNKEKFLRPETIRLWQIIVKPIQSPDRKGGDNRDDAAKKKIQEALKKLKAGEPFDVVAYKYSEDDYRVLGGDYGTVHRGQLAPELEKPAFAAKAKVLTGPFQTSFGWHILKIENRQPARQLKFEEVKEKIADSMRQKRLDQRKADFVRELKAAAKIQYLAPV